MKLKSLVLVCLLAGMTFLKPIWSEAAIFFPQSKIKCLGTNSTGTSFHYEDQNCLSVELEEFSLDIKIQEDEGSDIGRLFFSFDIIEDSNGRVELEYGDQKLRKHFSEPFLLTLEFPVEADEFDLKMSIIGKIMIGTITFLQVPPPPVSSIPLPAGLPLFGGAVSLLALLLRRRKLPMSGLRTLVKSWSQFLQRNLQQSW